MKDSVVYWRQCSSAQSEVLVRIPKIEESRTDHEADAKRSELILAWIGDLGGEERETHTDIDDLKRCFCAVWNVM